MFYEVRIKNPDGTLKKVVTQNILQKMHWENFEKYESDIGLMPANRPQVPAWVKRRLQGTYPKTGENFSTQSEM